VTSGCGDRSPAEPQAGYRMHVASGDGQRGAAGAPLANPLSVLVEDAGGRPAKGVRVRFAVTRGASGGSHVDDALGVTDGSGVTGVRLILGAAMDTTRVDVSLAVVDGVAVQFTAVAVPAPAITQLAPTDFRSGDTVTIGGAGFVPGATSVRIGGATAPLLAGATTTTIRAIVPPCLAAGAVAVPVSVSVSVAGTASNASPATYRATRAPIVLRPYEALTVPAARLSDCLSIAGDGGASGATYVVSAQFAGGTQERSFFDWRLAADGAAPLAAAALAAGQAAAAIVASTDRTALQRQLETELRALERRISAEARPSRSPGPAFARVTLPTVVGSLRGFSVVAAVDGSRFETVTARLRYSGDHVLVYTDTAGGADQVLADAKLTPLAQLMDRDLYGLTVGAFGAEPDVDGNGRVIVLLTPVVNRMSKASECVLRGYVTGFFYGLDELEREPDGNKGEIFYAFVPDSAGRHSCAHTESDMVRTLQGTFVHELQHLISFNQHVLARGGEVEQTWLNEGLSHIAEELGSKMYEARFPAPLGRSTKEQIFPDSAGPFIAPLLLNAYAYLNLALEHSVTAYEGVGSLEERGATWLFLRWLGDQKGDAIFRRLVEAPVTGFANVERASGEAFPALFGDFSLALFTDSLPGISRSLVAPRQRFLSRNLRQLMAREATIAGFPNPFPLTTYALGVGGSLRSAMFPGTMVHAIVRTPGANAPIRLSFTTPGLTTFAPSLGGQVSIMRLPP